MGDEEQVSRTVHESYHADSIEIGTPAKGGCIKIYHDASDMGGFMEKIDNMVAVRAYAQAKTGVSG